MMKLDRHKCPLYAQLRELIVERIQEGVYGQGERIPSSNALRRVRLSSNCQTSDFELVSTAF